MWNESGKDEYGYWGMNEHGMKFRWVKPGSFRNDRGDEVVVPKGFWLQDTEVTQGQWKAVMGSNPSQFKISDQHPVEGVKWNDCQEFVKALGRGYSLPSEHEWEYACRAGTTAPYYFDPKEIDDYAWYHENMKGTTQAVAQKKPNLWGFYDMLGNAGEWCQDRMWAEDTKRVVRSGGLHVPVQYCTADRRTGQEPGTPHGGIGLRVLRELE